MRRSVLIIVSGPPASGKSRIARSLRSHLGFAVVAKDDIKERLFDAEAIDLLREVCGEDRLHFELTRELLDVERTFATMSRRAGLFDRLEKAFQRGFYDDADDAVERARRKRDAKERSGDRFDLTEVDPVVVPLPERRGTNDAS